MGSAAMRTVIWMWVLLGLVIYVFSILFCNELGHQFPNDAAMQEWWGTVTRSSFTLYTVLTLEGWVDVARYLWDTSPVMVALLIVFISLTTYAIINVVVAVIVQRVVDEAISRKEDHLKRLDTELQERTQALVDVFNAADVNNDGSLSKEEWLEALERNGSAHIRRIFRLMDLDVGDLSVLFEEIDLNQNNRLSVHDFVQGVMQLRGSARARRLFEFHCDFSRHKHDFAQYTRSMDEMLAIQESMLLQQQQMLLQQQQVLADQSLVLRGVQDGFEKLIQKISPGANSSKLSMFEKSSATGSASVKSSLYSRSTSSTIPSHRQSEVSFYQSSEDSEDETLHSREQLENPAYIKESPALDKFMPSMAQESKGQHHADGALDRPRVTFQSMYSIGDEVKSAASQLKGLPEGPLGGPQGGPLAGPLTRPQRVSYQL